MYPASGPRFVEIILFIFQFRLQFINCGIFITHPDIKFEDVLLAFSLRNFTLNYLSFSLILIPALTINK